MKCKSCGKEITSPIEFDMNNFDVYCPDCGKKQVNLKILELYPNKKKLKGKKNEMPHM